MQGELPALLPTCSELTARRRTDWAEEEDEDQLALPAPQIVKNKDGTETIITHYIREDGKKMKTTRRIKKTIVKQVVNPRVAERKHWDKFGLEKGKAPGPQTDTTSVAENIVFRPQANWKASADDKSEHEKKKANLKDTKIKCRICSGDHWTTKCPFKDTMAPEGEPGAGGADMDEPEAAGGLGAGTSSYVPPHLRGRAGATGEKMGGKYERDDLATLRVTNVRNNWFARMFGMVWLTCNAGQRVHRGAGPARYLLALRSRHQSLPGEGQRNGPCKGLRFRQFRRPRRRQDCVREGRRL